MSRNEQKLARMSRNKQCNEQDSRGSTWSRVAISMRTQTCRVKLAKVKAYLDEVKGFKSGATLVG